MRMLFIIDRNIYYKFLGPIIDEALSRKYEVYCLHLYGQARNGVKGSQFPVLFSVPTFLHGFITSTIYYNNSDIVKFIFNENVRVVVSLHTPAHYQINKDNLKKVKWVCIQHGMDYFTSERKNALTCDLLCILSKVWWFNFVKSKYSFGDFDQWANALPRNVIVTGFPQLDVIESLSVEKIKKKYNLPPDKRILLYLPLDNPQLYPLNNFFKSQWLSKIFYPSSSHVKEKIISALGKAGGDWGKIMSLTEYQIIKSISEFCKKNNLYFLIKSRLKRPIEGIISTLVDAVYYDETFYPSTITELLYVSDIAVNLLSMVTYESVFLKSYAITISLELIFDEIGSHMFGEFWGDNWKEFHAVGGTSKIIPSLEFIRSFHEAHISDFEIDLVARKDYVQKYFTFDDANSSLRVLNAIEDISG